MADRRNKKWSDEEKQYVKDNYKELSVGELAKNIGRTEKAVRHKTSQMGIRLSDLGRGKWSSRECELLKEMFNEGKSDKELGKEIGKSTASIQSKRIRMGLKRREPRKGGEPYLGTDGYYKIYDGRGNKRFYHRVVTEDMLGRELRDEERVHHINFDKTDNRKENLFVCRNRSHHFKLHWDAIRLLERLYDRGIIRFNKNKEVYELCEKRK